MEAILVSLENREQITNSPNVTPGDVDVMMSFVDVFHVRYFLNDFDTPQTNQPLWSTWPRELFESTYDFDPEKIRTEFVTCTKK